MSITTLWDVFFAVAPDIPLVLFLAPPWNKDTWSYYILYEIPHSAAFAILINNPRYRKIYCGHIILDILTHTDPWSIRPFLPLKLKIPGFWDPIGW